MRIGIDTRKILNPGKGEAAGIGHYTYQLVRHLLKIDKTNDYVLFFDKNVEKKRLDKFKQKNVKICFFPFIKYKEFLPRTFSRFLEAAFIGRENLDVFHSPTLELPRSYKKTSVVTAHDLSLYKFPELFSGKERLKVKIITPYAARQAKIIITPSFSTKKDLMEMFKMSGEKIKVIAHGLDERFLAKPSPQKIKAVKKKYGIPGEYILFLGTLETRKNIIGIIEAYEKLRTRMIQVPNAFTGLLPDTKDKDPYKWIKEFKYFLVLAGKQGPFFDSVAKRIGQSRFKKDIILPGYIKPDDLVPLFWGAKVFLFPTLYEGFGLPVIEAMACHTPVITSNISSLPEVASGRAVLVNPYQTSDIANALIGLLSDQGFYQSLVKAGRARAAEFSWEKTAKETLEVYREIVKSKETKDKK
jgi:glycosyltransferase involved in cell wall biosynthesis